MRSKAKAQRRPATSDSLAIYPRSRKLTKAAVVLLAPARSSVSRRQRLARSARVATRSRRPHHTIPVSHAGAVFDLRGKFTSRRTWPQKLRIAHKGRTFDFVRVPGIKYRYQFAPANTYHPPKAKVSFDVLNDRPGSRVIKLDYLYYERPRNGARDPSGPAVIEAIKSIANKVILEDHSYVPDPARPAGSTIPRYLTDAPNLYAGFDEDPRQNAYYQEQRRVLTALSKPVRAKLTTSGGKVHVAMHSTGIPSKKDVQDAFFGNKDLADRILAVPPEKMTILSYDPDHPIRTWRRPKVHKAVPSSASLVRSRSRNAESRSAGARTARSRSAG